MNPTPILIVSDAPSAASGFARITRDLASRLHGSRLKCRVATAGFWDIPDPTIPFFQFGLGGFANDNLPLGAIATAARRWFQGEKGIILTIYDAARLTAFSLPQTMPILGSEDVDVQKFLLSPFGERWGYFPIDARGVGEKLTPVLGATISGFDRILAYGAYGQRILKNTLPDREVDFLPHGIDRSTFRPLGRKGREMLWRKFPTELKDPEGNPILGEHRVNEDDLLLGVVATNQARKDWGTVLEVLRLLPSGWKLWGHIDRLVNTWNIPELAREFGVQERVFFTNSLDDAQLAALYSTCDVTLAPGLGEGFGFPIVESMSCGTPVAIFDYAGGADLVPPVSKIRAGMFRLEGAYSFYRPVMDAGMIADKIQTLQVTGSVDWRAESEAYDWPGLWPRWEKWFEAGLTAFRGKNS